MFINSLIGFGLSLLIAFVAYYKKSLTLSGFIAAAIVGTFIYMFGSYIIWSLLIFFFVSSSILSKLHSSEDEKNGRNYLQVLTNSIVSLLFITLYYIFQDKVYMIVSAVAIAASTSDTWASEIGALSKSKPFSILTFKAMEKGLSGAVSIIGIIASLIGAAAISLLFVTLYYMNNPFEILVFFEYAMIILIAGFLGTILDSYLGAFLQAKYKDLKTGKIKEFIINTENYILISGKKIITNNTVNFIMILTISIVTYLLLII